MWKTMEKALKKNAQVTNDELKKVQPFIFLRWLGSHHLTIHAAAHFNLWNRIPLLNQFKIIQQSFGDKIERIFYIKGSETQQDSETINMISKYFYINTERAVEYLEFLSEEEISQIRMHFLKSQSQDRVTSKKLKGK